MVAEELELEEELEEELEREEEDANMFSRPERSAARADAAVCKRVHNQRRRGGGAQHYGTAVAQA